MEIVHATRERSLLRRKARGAEQRSTVGGRGRRGGMCVTSGLHALPLSPSRSLVRRSPLGALRKKEREGEREGESWKEEGKLNLPPIHHV